MTEARKAFRTEVAVKGETKWATNALTFDTEAEAQAYASDLCSRWMSTEGARVVLDAVPFKEPIDWNDARICVNWRTNA